MRLPLPATLSGRELPPDGIDTRGATGSSRMPASLWVGIRSRCRTGGRLVSQVDDLEDGHGLIEMYPAPAQAGQLAEAALHHAIQVPAYHAAVSFFEPPPRPPAGAARAMVVSPPAWLGPSHNVLPGIAPLQLIVGRTYATVVAVAGIQAYPAGFSFTLSLRLRNLSVREERRNPYPFDGADLDDDPLADDYLRFGVQFADGRKATTLDRPPSDPEGQAPDRPVLMQHGGGGGGAAWDMEHWLWPLPPAGPFAFVCAWPGRGIAESRAEIDAGLIVEAAERAVTLWPED